MDGLDLAREQAAQLKAAFDAGTPCIHQGPGDPYPVEEHEPLVRALLPDYSFTIQRFRDRACVVVEFGLDGGPPGLRWLHRFRPPSALDGEQDQAVMTFHEGAECGWIARSLARVRAGTSPVWTDFSWGHPAGRWSEALGLFGDGHPDQAVAVLREGDPDAEELDQADRIVGLASITHADTAKDLRDRIWQAFRGRNLTRQEADRAATAAFLKQHRSPDGSWSSAWSTSPRP